MRQSKLRDNLDPSDRFAPIRVNRFTVNDL